MGLVLQVRLSKLCSDGDYPSHARRVLAYGFIKYPHILTAHDPLVSRFCQGTLVIRSWIFNNIHRQHRGQRGPQRVIYGIALSSFQMITTICTMYKLLIERRNLQDVMGRRHEAVIEYNLPLVLVVESGLVLTIMVVLLCIGELLSSRLKFVILWVLPQVQVISIALTCKFRKQALRSNFHSRASFLHPSL
jgi:hypothetical protein